MKNPKDRVQRQIRKTYLSTPVGKLEQLLAVERRWKSKATLANNKLAAARRRLNDYAVELAKAALERGTP